MEKPALAQLNIARLLAPLDSPQLAEFVANLDRINALAEQSPGFLWRLQTEEGDATTLRPFGEDILVNMSLWQDLKTLRAFVFKSAHSDILRRRKHWFAGMADAYSVLWWVPQNHRPALDEANQKLEMLRSQGPSPQAFSFSKEFPAPE